LVGRVCFIATKKPVPFPGTAQRSSDGRGDGLPANFFNPTGSSHESRIAASFLTSAGVSYPTLISFQAIQRGIVKLLAGNTMYYHPPWILALLLNACRKLLTVNR
jgi:hypothetical protein